MSDHRPGSAVARPNAHDPPDRDHASGELANAALLAIGWSSALAAEILGYPVDQVRRWRSGRRPVPLDAWRAMGREIATRPGLDAHGREIVWRIVGRLRVIGAAAPPGPGP